MFNRIQRATIIALRRFQANQEGSVKPLFVLSLVPVLSLVGAAVDYTRVANLRNSLQLSLDGALLAGAKDGSIDWSNVALNYFNANVHAGDGTQGSATVKPSSGNYYCVMALNPTAQAALQLTGNASITIKAPKCVLQVNSKNLSAVTMNGNTTIQSVENCFVGGLQKVGNATIQPGPDAQCKAIPDPFASYPRPVVGQCDFTNFKLAGNKTMTLQPGVYCGGMSFNGPVNVTFAPGLYVIKDGVITETGGSFTGNGVTFFLTGTGASVQMSGQANWHLVAPASGGAGMPGFAIFLDPNGPSGLPAASSLLAGQAELYFEGIVYLPGQAVSVTGNAQEVAPSPYTSYIGDTLSFVGNAELIINYDTSLTSLPIPTALYVQTNGSLALTR
jgi:hypothetical protein